MRKYSNKHTLRSSLCIPLEGKNGFLKSNFSHRSTHCNGPTRRVILGKNPTRRAGNRAVPKNERKPTRRKRKQTKVPWRAKLWIFCGRFIPLLSGRISLARLFLFFLDCRCDWLLTAGWWWLWVDEWQDRGAWHQRIREEDTKKRRELMVTTDCDVIQLYIIGELNQRAADGDCDRQSQILTVTKT